MVVKLLYIYIYFKYCYLQKDEKQFNIILNFIAMHKGTYLRHWQRASTAVSQQLWIEFRMYHHIYQEPGVKLMSVKSYKLLCQQRLLKTSLSCQKAQNCFFLPVSLSTHQWPTRKMASRGIWGKQERQGGISSLKLCMTPARSWQETTLLAAPSLKGQDSCQITLKERLS